MIDNPQIEEDRSFDLHEFIEENWNEIMNHWNHEDFPIDDNGFCIQK